MKFREVLQKLNELAKTRPETLDMDCVYAVDDEGNRFETVGYTGHVGIYEDDEFIPEEQIEEYERDESELNAICIN